MRLHLVQNLLNVGGCRFLSLGEFLEGDEELSHDGLRRNHDPELIGIPALEQCGKLKWNIDGLRKPDYLDTSSARFCPELNRNLVIEIVLHHR